MPFRRIHDAPSRSVAVTVDGRPFEAQSGDTVAAVLLAAGVRATRVANQSGAPRAAYCMMGVCFECLVTVDGVGNRQACLVQVREGMKITTGHGKRSVSA